MDAVYRDVLARGPDPSGEQYWIGQINGGAPRSSIAQAFSHSQEYYTLLVNRDYLALLRRTADSGGLSYWVTSFQNGTSDERMVSNFIGSQEYFAWAQNH